MSPLPIKACTALLMVQMPGLALGRLVTRTLKATPFDTALPATFEGPDMIPLFPKGQVPPPVPGADAAGPAHAKQVSIDVFCRVSYPEGNVYLAQEPALKPYLLEHTDAKRSNAAIVIAPGGGQGFLAWEREGTNVAEWLNTLGINAFVLRYRVPSDESSALIDAQRAMSFVRYHAADYGLDPSRVGFMGFSAGGRMAADLSIMPQRFYSKIDEADDLDFHPDFALVIYGDGVHKITKDMRKPPPTFSISAQDDTCVNVDSATAYCTAIRRDSDQECLRIVYPNGGHGYGTCGVYTNKWSGDAVCAWTKDAESWMREHNLLKA